MSSDTNGDDEAAAFFAAWRSSCLEQQRGGGGGGAGTAAATASGSGGATGNGGNLRGKARSFFAERSSNRCAPDAVDSLLEALADRLDEPLNGGGGTTTRRQRPRLLALQTLLGALEGCCGSGGGSGGIGSGHLRRLGGVLVRHCGPPPPDSSSSSEGDDEDGDEDDLEDEIRDAAVSALSALVAVAACPFRPDPLGEVDELIEGARCRMQVSKRGVERRCRRTDEDADDEVGMGGGGYDDAAAADEEPIQAGLSLLPRSRRSLCFDLLRSAVDAVSSALSTVAAPGMAEQSAWATAQTRLRDEAREFAIFSTKCLHGESDPRCLLQLLRLFRAECEGFRPIFAVEAAAKAPPSSAMFPVVELFDAVAPYYPIQFSPPPNDTRGVTKSGLRDALFGVLGYTGYDDECAAKIDSDGGGGVIETMLQLSLGLVLERLVPLPDDEATITMGDKREALEDLTTLLFPEDGGSVDDGQRVRSLSVDSVRQLSNAMLAVTHEASTEVAKGGQDKVAAKGTADSCRALAARIALECERASAASGNEELWQVFVADPLRALSKAAVSTPSQGRIAIAYLACLTSCGGPKTVRRGLEVGLVPLMDNITTKAEQLRDDDLGTAIHGIGAFFAACRASLIKARERGVALSPHPLQPYSRRAVQLVGGYLRDGINLQLRIAAVRAMESILLASPPSNFDGDVAEEGGGSSNNNFSKFLLGIVDPLLVQNLTSLQGGDVQETQWLQACSQAAGCILGFSLGSDDESTERVESVLQSEAFRTSVKERFLPMILTSALTPTPTTGGSSKPATSVPRYDWKVLVKACSTRAAAVFIVGSLATSLRDALDQNRATDVKLCGRVLNLVFCNGGANASRAFHELSAPSATASDVIRSLYAFGKQGGAFESKGMESGFGTSMLELPPSEDDRKKLDAALQRVHKIASMLRPAYQTQLPPNELRKLFTNVSNPLPPLNETDAIKLSVLLPLLSATVTSSVPDRNGEGEMIDADKMRSLVTDLAEFSLNPENFERSRSHASVCLQQILADFTSQDSETCLCRAVITDLIIPSLNAAAIEGPRVRISGPSMGECFGLLSVVGSAAACRGGCSSKTADAVALFFVDLACIRKGSLSFGEGHSFDADFSGRESGDEVAFAAASSLGSFLSTESKNLIWKQRVAYLAAKRLQNHAGAVLRSTSPAPAGVLACACYITCCSKLQVIGSTNLNMLALLVARGLSSSVVGQESLAVTKLVLAALLKLLAVAPTTLSGNAPFLVIGVMRAFASCPEPTSGIAMKLLALQALESIAYADSHLTQLSEVKPAVVSILATAMNHPSSVLRQAAVEVRNAWYVAGNM